MAQTRKACRATDESKAIATEFLTLNIIPIQKLKM